jgi:hypothetical protein
MLAEAGDVGRRQILISCEISLGIPGLDFAYIFESPILSYRGAIP